MDILYLMILCSVSLAAVFLVVFIVNAKKGQFEDDESPAVRILLTPMKSRKKRKTATKKARTKKEKIIKLKKKVNS
ncbi:cbb3-type cytochrome oxidase assembly protein CcoS [Chryseobacterium wanjuense]